jgi:hypothetical protein
LIPNRRSDASNPISFLGDFNIKKIFGMFNEASTAAQKGKSGIVDTTLRKVVEVAYNLFEFVKSHNELLDGTGRLDDLASKTANEVFTLGGIIPKDIGAAVSSFRQWKVKREHSHVMSNT